MNEDMDIWVDEWKTFEAGDWAHERRSVRRRVLDWIARHEGTFFWTIGFLTGIGIGLAVGSVLL